jgi:hypothetical protein
MNWWSRSGASIVNSNRGGSPEGPTSPRARSQDGSVVTSIAPLSSRVTAQSRTDTCRVGRTTHRSRRDARITAACGGFGQLRFIERAASRVGARENFRIVDRRRRERPMIFALIAHDDASVVTRRAARGPATWQREQQYYAGWRDRSGARATRIVAHARWLWRLAQARLHRASGDGNRSSQGTRQVSTDTAILRCAQDDGLRAARQAWLVRRAYLGATHSVSRRSGFSDACQPATQFVLDPS